ncbi:MAG: nitrilase-related carbon-nitrogen hydrolase, partial [Actinomycetota bacterium]|nr:nitrilase-related carbon-nitrogen hydrolase [Actinomycetota bacterium]
MSKRKIKIGAAQLGPIDLHHSRQEIIQRLINLMMQASDSGADLIVYPELALTTFFPRWFIEEKD